MNNTIEYSASVLSEATTISMMNRRMRSCPSCGGRGWHICGRGHYGDCNGDAGERKKIVPIACNRCLGWGHVTPESDIEYNLEKAGVLDIPVRRR